MKLEHGAALVLRDLILDHMGKFAHVIRREQVAGRNVTAAYVDGLAGACALCVAGGQGSREEIEEAAIKAFRDALRRDLAHLATQ